MAGDMMALLQILSCASKDVTKPGSFHELRRLPELPPVADHFTAQTVTFQHSEVAGAPSLRFRYAQLTYVRFGHRFSSRSGSPLMLVIAQCSIAPTLTAIG